MSDHSSTFSGTVYRAHNPRWAYAPESGEGAKKFGGRFNRPGTPALYTSLSPETAWLEAQQGFAFKAQPMTLCAYEAEFTKLYDLRDADVLASLNVTLADLGCAWEAVSDEKKIPPTWRMAERLMSMGVSGILVPSFASGAKPHDVNAVFWKWGPAMPHRLVVIDDLDRLPRNDDSWR